MPGRQNPSFLFGTSGESPTEDLGETKKSSTLLVMAVRSCRVTITDLDGVSHTAEVTASTLLEAVALGLMP